MRAVCAHYNSWAFVGWKDLITCKTQMNLNGAISKIFTLSQQQITVMYLQGLNEVVDQNQWLKNYFLTKPKKCKSTNKTLLKSSCFPLETYYTKHRVMWMSAVSCTSGLRKQRRLYQHVLNDIFLTPTSLLTFKQSSQPASQPASHRAWH